MYIYIYIYLKNRESERLHKIMHTFPSLWSSSLSPEGTPLYLLFLVSPVRWASANHYCRLDRRLSKISAEKRDACCIEKHREREMMGMVKCLVIFGNHSFFISYLGWMFNGNPRWTLALRWGKLTVNPLPQRSVLLVAVKSPYGRLCEDIQSTIMGCSMSVQDKGWWKSNFMPFQSLS